jgi:hypothetical protein
LRGAKHCGNPDKGRKSGLLQGFAFRNDGLSGTLRKASNCSLSCRYFPSLRGAKRRGNPDKGRKSGLLQGFAFYSNDLTGDLRKICDRAGHLA